MLPIGHLLTFLIEWRMPPPSLCRRKGMPSNIDPEYFDSP